MEVRAALTAMKSLIANPDDTAQVFRIIEALSGKTAQRLVRRLRKQPGGRALLRDRPQLIRKLRDRDALELLPPDSFGHAYVSFCRNAEITPDGLRGASDDGLSGTAELDDDEQYISDRMRDAHDLWHVATGYDSDVVGEASLLAFTFAQTNNRGIGFIAMIALLQTLGDAGAFRTISNGFRRGRRASWLPLQHWEALMAAPLHQVRSELGLSDTPLYERIFTADLPVR